MTHTSRKKRWSFLLAWIVCVSAAPAFGYWQSRLQISSGGAPWAGSATNLGTAHSISASSTVTVAASAAIGDVVVVTVARGVSGATGCTVSDSGGNTWNIIGSTLTFNAGSDSVTAYYSVLTTGLTSGVSTIVGACSGSGNTDTVATKLTQLAASPLDSGATATATGTGTTPSVTSNAAGRAGEVFIGVAVSRNSTVCTPGGGFSAPPNALTGSSGPTDSTCGGNVLNAGSGAKTYSATTSNVAFGVMIFAFHN